MRLTLFEILFGAIVVVLAFCRLFFWFISNIILKF